MMNQEDVFKKIGAILNEIQDQYEFLAQNPKQLNELELELFLANASFLTDHVQILQKINNSRPVKAIPEHTAVNPEEIVAPVPAESAVQEKSDPVKEELFKLDDQPASFEFILNDKPLTDRFEFEEQSVNDIFDRPLSEEEQQIIAQKQKLHSYRQEEPVDEHDLPDDEAIEEAHPADIEDEIGPEPFLVPKTETPITETRAAMVIQETPAPADTTIPQQPAAKLTLNEMLAGNIGGNKTSVQTEKPKPALSDLKQGITLNDKLLYIKDLFNGYNLAYAEAIDLLNKMPDFKAADDFLQSSYALKHNWGAKQTTVDQFYEVLNRRFPKV